MSTIPLTHHEILRLVAPFTEHGRHVDLRASERAARVLHFRATEHPGPVPLRETLRLECSWPRRVRLLRTLEHPCGLRATLQVDAADVAGAVQRVMAVPPQSQFPLRGGVPVAESLVGGLSPPSRISGTRESAPTLVRAEARVAGITLRVEAPERSLVAAQVRLLSTAGEHDLPGDLLCVLGRAWRPLRPTEGGWKSTIRVTPRVARRGAELRARSASTVEHLSRTLGEPPSRFHARFRRQRWQVALRRAMPLLISVTLPLAVLAVVAWGSGQGVDWHPLAQFIPPLMLAAAFIYMSRELPVFEWPPLPRPLPAGAWPGVEGEETSAQPQGSPAEAATFGDGSG